MGWEKRQRGGLYYTESYRENGRVRRRYIGCGPLAEAIALLQENERDEKCERRRTMQEEMDRLAKLDREAREYSRRVREVFSAAMEAVGYHRHNRGEWRKRRNGNEEEQPGATGEADAVDSVW